MKPKNAARALAIVAFGLLAAASAGAVPAAKSIKWYTNYDKAVKAATSQKKILMVDFFTTH